MSSYFEQKESIEKLEEHFNKFIEITDPGRSFRPVTDGENLIKLIKKDIKNVKEYIENIALEKLNADSRNRD